MGSKKCPVGCTCGKHTKSVEHRQRLSEVNRNAWTPEMREEARQRNFEAFQDPETRQRHKDGLLRTWQDEEITQRRKQTQHDTWVERYGERREFNYASLQLTGHPLAKKNGTVHVHRLVLWEKLGCESLDCEHECHWCGKLLVWGGHKGICVDHVDEDPTNNDPENLVPSCNRCNTGRRIIAPT